MNLSGRHIALIMLWSLLYYLTGELSLWLSDPANRIAFVWFPAGIAVSSMLFSARKTWPYLLAGLFLARTSLDILHHHHMMLSLVLSALSLTSNFLIAVSVRYWSRADDALNTILIWLGATLIITGGFAFAASELLRMMTETPLHLVWVWWAANVSGVIFVTVIVAGFLRKPPQPTHRPVRSLFTGVLLWLICSGLAWYIFGQDLHTVKEPLSIFILTCLPVMLTVIIALLWGNFAGSLALLTLGTIVIFHSSQGLGPFFLHRLRQDESLLLAQCYLCTTALLLSFIHILTRSVARFDERIPSIKATLRYQLAMSTSQFIWETVSPDAPDMVLPVSMSQLARHVSPEDMAKLERQWSDTLCTGTSPAPVTFQIKGEGENLFIVTQDELVNVVLSQGNVIIGKWIIHA